ncbi:nucleolar protein 14 homolog [Pieris napi]|uniref:nucleolar protein 14 homolog n=1 Tax=Pieris napi TaxID=78633 RepID=UPI001FB8E5DE|nr:nucleolar protein 14 homolog [Pieris napi]
MAKVKNKRNAGLADKVHRKKSEGVKKKLNPFEVHINKEKLKVLGKKSKHDGLPGVSRAKAIQKRKETIGTEMKLLNKTNTFIDRRIGEKSNNLSAEDRMIARFAAERAKQHNKKSIYNLADDEILTHRGQTLEQIEKFDDPRSDDEDEDKPFGGLDDDFVSEGHFGGGILSKTESKDGAKSHKDLIEQLIAESKKRKAEKQKEKEQTLDLTEKLDSEWKDLQPVVFKKQSESLIDKLLADAEKGQDYDKMMRELKFDRRGTPSDALKSTEKQLEEERKKLEEMEKQRQQRMMPEEEMPKTAKPTVKHRSADDLDDNFAFDDEKEIMLAYDKDGKPLLPDHILKDYNVPNAKKKFDDGVSDTSSEEGDEINDESGSDNEVNGEADSEDNDEDEQKFEESKEIDENSNNGSDLKVFESDGDDDKSDSKSEDNEKLESSNENKRKRKISHSEIIPKKVKTISESSDEILENHMNENNENIRKENVKSDKNDEDEIDDDESDADESGDDENEASEDTGSNSDEKEEMDVVEEELGSVFDVKSAEGDKLRELLTGKTPSQQSTALSKLIKSYDPSLSPNNKEILSRLFAHLLQYVHDIFTDLNDEGDIIKAFLIFDKVAPYFYDLIHINKVSTKKFIVELLKEKHDQFKRNPKKVPDLNTLIFFKLVSLLYPTSDFRHPVTTPSLIFMTEILSLSRFKDAYSVSRGLFILTMILEYTVLSKRFVPSALNFLRGIFYLSANTSVLNPVQVVPPFRLHKDSKILNLEQDCSKMEVDDKMSANDLVCEMDDAFKIKCLHNSVCMLREFFDNYIEIDALKALFEPHMQLLGRIDLEWYPKKIVSKVTKVLQHMKETLETKTYALITREKVRPKALRLYEPDIQEVFTGSKLSKLSRDASERKRLQGKYKKEMKGAIREIRRDKAYIASVKIRQKIQSDNVRKEKVKQIYKDASIQQGELNKLKRGK